MRAKGRADFRPQGVAAEDLPEPLAGEGAAAMVEEELGYVLLVELRTGPAEVIVDPGEGRARIRVAC